MDRIVFFGPFGVTARPGGRVVVARVGLQIGVGAGRHKGGTGDHKGRPYESLPVGPGGAG